MTLDDYLRRENLTNKAFGEKIGAPAQTVHRYRKKLRIPNEEVMRKIFDVTGGDVTANDFFGLKRAS